MTSAGRRMMEDDVTDDLYTANRLLHSGKSKLLKASRERKRAIKKDRKKRGALQRKANKQIRKACKKAEASIAARGREATPNTPTRGRGAPERKRDDAERSNSRAIIGAGSVMTRAQIRARSTRSTFPDLDLPVIHMAGDCSQCGRPVCSQCVCIGFSPSESEKSDSSVEDDSVGPVTP